MRSFLANLRFLILPVNASPPTVGQPIIVIQPGPPPGIFFYTGHEDETAPGSIQSFVDVPFDLMATIINGPDSAGIGTPQIQLGQDLAGVFSYALISADSVLLGTGASDDTVQAGSAIYSSASQMQNKAESTAGDQAITSTSGVRYDPSGVGLGFTFKAPPSGMGILAIGAMLNAPANERLTVWGEVREGTTIGSGTIVFNGDAQGRRVGHFSTSAAQEVEAGNMWPVGGLTFNDDYNATVWAKVSGGTGNVLGGTVQWVPLIGQND